MTATIAIVPTAGDVVTARPYVSGNARPARPGIIVSAGQEAAAECGAGFVLVWFFTMGEIGEIGYATQPIEVRDVTVTGHIITQPVAELQRIGRLAATRPAFAPLARAAARSVELITS